MPSYAAFIGHQPHLSIAELSAAVPDFKFSRILGNNVTVFESSADLDRKSLSMLGGTVVIARQMEEKNAKTEDVPALLASMLANIHGKVTFSIRTFGMNPGEVRALYKASKDYLRKHGKPSRYVGNERTPAATVLLKDAGLLDGKHGGEIVILKAKDFLWIGKTVAAQDVDAYTKRDIKKPVRDTRMGLLPPKLAQILLNFGEWLVKQGKSKTEAGAKKKAEPALTILDPFCGMGVIPMECLLRGWTVLASDLSLKAVNGTTKNLEWLRKEDKILKKDVPSTIWKQDATKPFMLKERPDAVVTETSLGPALTDRSSLKDALKFKTENEKLQAAFLRSMAQSFPGVPVICTWPVWFLRKEQIYLEKIWEVLHELGYQAVLPPGIEGDVPGRLSLMYRRPDQFVGREIVMLRSRKN